MLMGRSMPMKIQVQLGLSCVGMKSVRNDKNMHYHFLSYFFTRKPYENDMLENNADNEKSIHRKQNHQIENTSISIDDGTSNRKH
jgi:hypothetical protein